MKYYLAIIISLLCVSCASLRNPYQLVQCNSVLGCDVAQTFKRLSTCERMAAQMQLSWPDEGWTCEGP